MIAKILLTIILITATSYAAETINIADEVYIVSQRDEPYLKLTTNDTVIADISHAQLKTLSQDQLVRLASLITILKNMSTDDDELYIILTNKLIPDLKTKND